jgi:alginate O-acetyltransferase complex protein AlgF
MNRSEFFATLAAFAIAAISAGTASVHAQPAGQLYDPIPPSDSGYVRVILVGETPIDIQVDGKPRVAKLKGSEVSDYMVLKAGMREITLMPQGKSAGALKYKLDVPQGKAVTVAFSALKADAAKVHTDTANTNKLKSVLGVYHLHEKAGALDVSTADGSTKVFTNLAPGASNFLSVNPISVDLVAGKAGAAPGNDTAKLSMTQGSTYSLFILPGAGGKTQLVALQNKTERYTGK